MTASLDTIRRTAVGAFVSLRMNLLIAAQYRVNLVVWLFVSVLQAVVYLSVWQAIATSNGGSTEGFTPAQFAGYYLVMLIMVQLVGSVSIVGEFSGFVRRGTLSLHLVRPLHPIAYVLGSMFAFKLQFLAALPPVFAALWIVFETDVNLRGTALLAMLALLPLGLAARITCDALVACSAMWLTRIDGLRSIYGLLTLLLSGHLVPLDLMPAPMQSIATGLPFYWMLGFPTELLIGRAPLTDTWVAIAVLGAWSSVLYLLLQPVWRAGTRAYEAVGT